MNNDMSETTGAGESAVDPATNDTSIRPNVSRSWQFSLRSLFLITTAVAIAAALVAKIGWGTLVLSSGLTLTWFNIRGDLARWQTREWQFKLFVVMWVLYVVSLALPAVQAWGPVNGGQAAFFLATTEWEALVKTVEVPDDSFVQSIEKLLQFIWITFVNLTNILIILSPVYLWRLRRGGGLWYTNALALGSVCCWTIAFDGTRYLVGAYVWYASLMVGLVIRRPTWRTGAAMSAVAAICLLSLWLQNTM